jgi:hypothetical protein
MPFSNRKQAAPHFNLLLTTCGLWTGSWFMTRLGIHSEIAWGLGWCETQRGCWQATFRNEVSHWIWEGGHRWWAAPCILLRTMLFKSTFSSSRQPSGQPSGQPSSQLISHVKQHMLASLLHYTPRRSSRCRCDSYMFPTWTLLQITWFWHDGVEESLFVFQMRARKQRLLFSLLRESIWEY